MTAAAASAPRASLSLWQRHLLLLAGLWGVILAALASDGAALVRIWWNSSTFNHILIMWPLIGWLVWQRRDVLRQIVPVAWAPGLALLFAAGLVWLVGQAAGVAMVRQFGLVFLCQAAVATALGPRAVQALAFPLAYAWLTVPFGEELVPALQTITASLSMVMLGWAGIPAHIEGIFITTPNGFFEVAEACSGVKFLIAMGAYAVFAAHVGFRSWTRRVVFVAGALVTTVLANAVRAWATIVIGDQFGREYAEGFDHIVFGWVFFGLVMLVVMVLAWRWFDRPAGDPPLVMTPRLAAPAALTLPLWPAGLAALALLVVPLAWDRLGLDRAGALPDQMALAVPPGWTMGGTPDPVWKARFDGADHFIQRRLTRADGMVVDVAIAAFTHQDEGRELVGFGQGAADPDGNWTWASRDASAGGRVAGAPVDRLFHKGPLLRDAVSFYRIGGRWSSDARTAKLHTLLARLGAGEPQALGLLLSSEQGAGGAGAIAAFLDDAGGAQAIADGALKSR